MMNMCNDATHMHCWPIPDKHRAKKKINSTECKGKHCRQLHIEKRRSLIHVAKSTGPIFTNNDMSVPQCSLTTRFTLQGITAFNLRSTFPVRKLYPGHHCLPISALALHNYRPSGKSPTPWPAGHND